MASKQDNPNVGHTNHSSDSESDSVDSSRSETDVQATVTTTAAFETQPGPQLHNNSVRDSMAIKWRPQDFNCRSDISASKDFQPPAMNLSGNGSGLSEGTAISPVQENLEQLPTPPKTSTDARLTYSEQNSSDDTRGSNTPDQQSWREEFLKLQSQFMELQSNFLSLQLDLQPSNFAEFRNSVHRSVTEKINILRKELVSLIVQSAEASKVDLNTLQKTVEDRMDDLVCLLAQEVKVISKVTGLSPDSSAGKAWKEFLSRGAGRLEPGMFLEVDPCIMNYECSTRPNGKALVYVRESFKGLFESIMSANNAHRVQSTASDQTRQPTDRNPDPTKQAKQDQMRESNAGTGSTTATDQTNPIATDTENQTDEAPASPTTARTTPITGNTDEPTPITRNKDEPTPITDPGKKYLITGTPGTGKSCFAYYLLHHLLAKEGDSVLYQNCHKDMKFFVVIRRSKGGFEIEHYPMPTNSLPKHKQGFLGKGNVSDSAEKPVFWYIFDSGHKSAAKPESTDVPTIVISSPDYDQYKDFMLKCPEKFYMPTWEWPEIDAVVRQLHPDKSAQMNASVKEANDDCTGGKISVAKKQERMEGARRSFSERFSASDAFKMHGGVIRDVLNHCSESRLHAAIDRSDVDMVLQFLQARGDVSSAVSHRILHQKCDKKLDNGCVDYQKPSICFASKYVQDRFWDKQQQKKADLNLEQLSLMYELIPADGSPHSEECRRKFGAKFEDLVHTTIAKGPHKAKELLSDKAKSKLKTISLEFTSSNTIRPSQYLKTDDHIVCTIDTKAEDKEAYVRPGKGFPAFDAFLPGQKYLLQITIAKNHPVAVPELLSFIYTRRWRPKDVTLVFVVLDQIYDSFSYQDHKKTKKQKQNKTQESEKLEEVNKLSPEEIEDFKKIKQYAMPMPPRQLLHKQ